MDYYDNNYYPLYLTIDDQLIGFNSSNSINQTMNTQSNNSNNSTMQNNNKYDDQFNDDLYIFNEFQSNSNSNSNSNTTTNSISNSLPSPNSSNSSILTTSPSIDNFDTTEKFHSTNININSIDKFQLNKFNVEYNYNNDINYNDYLLITPPLNSINNSNLLNNSNELNNSIDDIITIEPLSLLNNTHFKKFTITNTNTDTNIIINSNPSTTTSSLNTSPLPNSNHYDFIEDEDKELQLQTITPPQIFNNNNNNNNNTNSDNLIDRRSSAISDSRLSLNELSKVLNLSDIKETSQREKNILKLLKNELGFEIGQRTWIRDTPLRERTEIIDKLFELVEMNYNYGYSKKILEIIIRRASYYMMQGRLRRERRAERKRKSTT